MAQTMTPSANEVTPMTGGQIGKVGDLLASGLRKAGLPSDAAQQVIETQGDALTTALVAVVRKYVEALAGMFSRRVKVNRSRSGQEALDATGRAQYTGLSKQKCGSR